MIIHDKKNFLAGVLYVAFGALVAIGAAHYDLGTAQRMGPGYFPLALGLLLMAVGLVVASSALGTAGPRTELGDWPLGTVAVVLLSVVLFGLLLKPLGLLVASVVLILASARAHSAWNWRTSIISAAILVPATAIIFVGLLGLRLPLLPSVF
jgi:hypothetical protein